MTQEMQLIDTIFYFVDTMDEYRQVLENNKILSRVIVFVDETQEIYKDGKLFGGYQKSVEKIKELAEEVRQAMDQSENDMRQLISEIRQQVWDNFTDEVELITRNLEDYADQLDKLKREFAEGEIEEGQVIQTVDQLKGQINDYVSWKSSIQQEFIQMSRTMDAYNGVLRTFAQRLDTQEDKVTNYEHLLDLKEQSLREYIESYDITNKVRSILGREMLLQEGLLHDYATITDVDNLTRQSVDTYMNSKTPSWTEVTSWASAGYDAAGRLRPLEIAVAGFDSRIQSAEAQASMFSNWYTENADALAYLKTFANDHSSGFDIMAAFDENNGNNELVRKAAARIFGYANSEGSNLVLQADHIQMDGSTFKINVSQVEGLGDWALNTLVTNKYKAVDGAGKSITINALPTSQTDGVYGIKSSTGGFYFSMDGSGWVANENIKWDAQGNLTIKGDVDGPNSMTKIENVYISNYWSKTEFNPNNYVQSGQVGSLALQDPNLQSWVLNKIAAAQLDQGAQVTVEEVVQSTLQAEIAKANGLFQGFTRNSDLNATLDGYTTKEGLLTTLRGKIYDANGDVIANDLLGEAFSNLKKMTGALIKNGEVIGLVSSADLTTEVNNAITGNSTISQLQTWSQEVKGSMSSGFNLQALINKLTESNVADGASNSVQAYIRGIVTDESSSIEITADQIIFNGQGEWKDSILVKDSSNNEVAAIYKDGRIQFNRGGVTIPTYTSSQSGTGGGFNSDSNGIIVDDKNGIKSYLQTNGLNIQSSGGNVYGGIWSNGEDQLHLAGFKNGVFGSGASMVLAGNYHGEGYVEIHSSENGEFVVSGFDTHRFMGPISIEDNVVLGTVQQSNGFKLVVDHGATFSGDLDAYRIVCGNSGLWVQGDSQFDGVCTFNDECDFNNTAEFSQDVDFGSSSNISVGGISTVTQTVNISGKTLTFRKGMLVGITG